MFISLQSGSLYSSLFWFVSEKLNNDVRRQIRQETDCCANLTSSIYSCLEDMSAAEVMKLRATVEEGRWSSLWLPNPDNDFFADSINDEDYEFPNEYVCQPLSMVPPLSWNAQ